MANILQNLIPGLFQNTDTPQKSFNASMFIRDLATGNVAGLVSQKDTEITKNVLSRIVPEIETKLGIDRDKPMEQNLESVLGKFESKVGSIKGVGGEEEALPKLIAGAPRAALSLFGMDPQTLVQNRKAQDLIKTKFGIDPSPFALDSYLLKDEQLARLTDEERDLLKDYESRGSFSFFGLSSPQKAKIQDSIKNSILKADSQETAMKSVQEIIDTAINTPGEDKLQKLKAIRAQLNKSMFDVTGAGGTGYYKQDFKLLQTAKTNPEVSKLVDTMESGIAHIDEVIQDFSKVDPKEKLSHLMNYHDTLRRLGLTEDEASRIGSKRAREIFENLDPEVLSALKKPKRIIQKTTEGQPKVFEFDPTDIDAFQKSMEKKGMDVTKKVNFFDYFRTPENVLKKIGLDEEANLLRSSYEGYKSNLREELLRIKSWQERTPEPGASKRIFQYLDGTTSADTLSPVEQQVGDEIKTHLRRWADRLDLPEDKRVSDYITHIFERGKEGMEFDPDLARLIDSSGVPSSVYDPFLQKRLDKPQYIEDVWRSLEAYTKRGSRKVNMDPALEKLSTTAQDLDVESYKYIERLGKRINMQPQEIDNLIDNFIKSTPIGYRLGQRPTTVITQSARRWIYRGTLGGNIGSAVRNLTQGINTYSVLGEKYTVVGYKDLVTRMLSKDLDELYKHGILDDNIIQDRQVHAAKGALIKFDEVLWSMFDTAEKINRGSAYFGGKKKALAKGMSESEAIDFAKKVVRDTQFTFGSIDTPVALQGDIVKTLSQFQSYNLKQLEFLAGMMKRKDFAGLVRFTGATVAMLGTVGKILGMEPEDSLPFGDFVTGSGRFTPPIAQLTSNLKGLVSLDEDERNKAKEDLKRSAAMIFPAGVQIKKSVEGLGAFERGFSATKTGRARFPIEQTPQNLIRAVLFGQFNLPGAQQYFDEGAKPLGEKQTRQVERGGQAAFNAIINKRQSKKKMREQIKALDAYKKASPAQKEYLDGLIEKMTK